MVTANGREEPLLVGTLMSEVVPERVEWLWPGRLPFGKIAVLDGDPGLGKSVLTLDIAARVSAGRELPDGQTCKPAGVVLLSAEDGAQDTIRPRLDAAGADLERIWNLPTVLEAKKGERMFSLANDLPLIERAIEHVAARFVVVDPLTAFIPESFDVYKDQHMRQVLGPAAALADRTRAAILVVRHLNKATGGNTLYRGGGSIGIIAAVRSGLMIGQDPEDPERRILAANKQNLSRPTPSLALRIEEAPNGAARVVWDGVSTLTAGDILKEPEDPEQKSLLSWAKEFLLQKLSQGPVTANEAISDALSAGISERTLTRAKGELRIVSKKMSDGAWVWKLPDNGIKGGHLPTSRTPGTVGILGKDANLGPMMSADIAEVNQGSQEGQGNHEERCLHGFPGGVGCSLCDQQHRYRLERNGQA